MLYEAWAEEMPYPAYESIPMPAVHCMDLIHDGKMTIDQIDDLGDAMIGKIPMHRKENEIVVYSVGGHAHRGCGMGHDCLQKTRSRRVSARS